MGGESDASVSTIQDLRTVLGKFEDSSEGAIVDTDIITELGEKVDVFHSQMTEEFDHVPDILQKKSA